MIAKRRTTLLHSLGRIDEAIKALTEFLGSSPTDVEAWSELSDLYYALSMLPQALYCLEEALLVTPSAWNVRLCDDLLSSTYLRYRQIHARLGELLLSGHAVPAVSSKLEMTQGEILVQAVQRFCRSVELCDGYFRGLLGLRMVGILHGDGCVYK